MNQSSVPETDAGYPHDTLHSRAFFLRVQNARGRGSRHFTEIAAALESRPLVSFLLLLIVVIPGVLGRSLDKPLWHDELFTFYISHAPSLSVLFSDTRMIDLNPPLSYLLTRVSFAMFGVNTLTCRLPEMMGFLVAMLSLFLFVRRRAGALYGLLAATLLYTGAAAELTAEARPYGLLLGFGSLSLLGWQKARAHDRLGIPLMLLGGFGMLLSHVFSVFLWSALAGAEVIRILQRRRIGWALVAAWILPLVCIWTYVPLLRSHGGGTFPSAFQPSIHTIATFYDSWVERDVRCVLLTGLVLVLLAGRQVFRGVSTPVLTLAEWAATVFVLSVPLVILTQLIRSHAAFFPRYTTAGNIGLSVFTAVTLAWWTSRDIRAALLCIGIAMLSSGQLHAALNAIRHQPILTSTEPAPTVCEACELSQRLDPSIPFVDASGLTFLEMDHRESDTMLQRVFYLTDPIASATYAHANIFEGMAVEKSLFPMRANVSIYADFVRLHHRFFVFGEYGFPEDWLLRKLQVDGASLRLVGQMRSSYRDRDLYYVSF